MSTTDHPFLTVSILVHHDFSHIHNALNDLYQTSQFSLAVYVVVNAGSEDAINELAQAFPQMDIIINENPQGFAANHNMIMRRAKTAYVALLNDDITVHPEALNELVGYLDNHSDVAVVGPQLLWADGSPQVTAYSDPSLLRMLYKISGLASLTHQKSLLRRWIAKSGLFKSVASLQTLTEAQEVPVIKGAVMVVRRAAYEQIGLMDEATQAYGEEVDWHWRFRQAGWKIAFVPTARITHYGTGQAHLALRGWQIREDRKAILNYFLKHRPRWQAIIIRAAIIVAHTIWGIFWVILLQKSRAWEHFDTAKMGATWAPRPMNS